MKRKLLNRVMTILLCVTVLLCGAVTGASAAESRLIVQLNGEVLKFTDAEPLNRYNRNFLPFRAVFEALGAEVDYYHPTRTAFAIRGDVRVDIPIGDDKIYITRNGEVEVLQMDVETFTKNGRTYVPVRFVAQALGCLVEWDQKNLTVVIIDLERLTEQAMAEQEYTFLGESLAFLQQFECGNWAIEGTMDYEAAVNGEVMITAETEFHGLVAEGGKEQLFLSVMADYSPLYRKQADALGVRLEDLGVAEEEIYPFVEMEKRTDASAGTNYVYLSTAIGLRAGIPENKWLTGEDATGILGTELSMLQSAGTGLDVASEIRSAVEKLKLTDSTKAYKLARDRVYEIAQQFSDRSVISNLGVDTLTWEQEGVTHTMMASYEWTGDVSALVWKQESGGEENGSVTQMAADKNGTVIVTATVRSGSQTVTAEQSAVYRPTDVKPVTRVTQADIAAG